MASRFSRPGRAACLALALVALALLLGASSACVREVIQPVTESTLVVARSANDVTLSWHAIGGMYYTLLYASSQGADADWKAMDGAVKDIEGWVECFPKARLAGVVRGVGLTAEGDIHERPGVLEESLALGRQC